MKSVIRGNGYILAHVPDMVLHDGTTQSTERIVNPDSEYLKRLPSFIRSYDQALAYWPNQTYIGNKNPEDLKAVPQPWYDKTCDVADRSGKYGEILPEDEFYMLMQASDVFDLVKLEEGFVQRTKPRFTANPIIDEGITSRLPDATTLGEVRRLIKEEGAEGLYLKDDLVGCVKRAHNIDVNLSAHVMCENIVSKASSVLALLYGVRNTGIQKSEIEYVIDCSEEACGDMNQRGGGNFAKAAAEIAGLSSASGSDLRGFCAAPAHAMVEAAALVTAGVYSMVAVSAGGCTAKLGMNGKDHIKKNIPILEDMIGGFCVIISKDNGVDPVIDLGLVGRHTVGTGSAPQAVISSLVTAPLARQGLKILDIDKYSAELQNPDITKPAGAGDVPLANYKMIGALAAKTGEISPKELGAFVETHGLVGWAPTQGHIPSGVPYVGFAREGILKGELKRVMIIGKGSLFLGRMTNLFDGISFVIRANECEEKSSEPAAVTEREIRGLIAKAMRDFAASLTTE